jgi:hypothetical protein
MICDSKRLAYVRIPAEDLLYAVCEGEKGLQNGTIQTLFLRVSYFIFILNLFRKIFI